MDWEVRQCWREKPHPNHGWMLGREARQCPGLKPGSPKPQEELVHVGWFCWRAGGHLAEMACRSDCVPIHVPKEWEKDMREYLRKLEDEPDE